MTIADVIDFLLTREWWRYDPAADWYASPYHWINLVEGAAWLIFAALVLTRYARHRHSPIELAYAGAFLTFGVTDFREAYVVHSWLILVKGANLALLLYLRWVVIRRYYPESKTY